jgi:hypothetical protein
MFVRLSWWRVTDWRPGSNLRITVSWSWPIERVVVIDPELLFGSRH